MLARPLEAIAQLSPTPDPALLRGLSVSPEEAEIRTVIRMGQKGSHLGQTSIPCGHDGCSERGAIPLTIIPGKEALVSLAVSWED